MKPVSSVALLIALTAPAFAAGPATTPATRPVALTVLDPAGRPVKAATVISVPTPPKIDRYFVYDGTLRPWVAGGYRQTSTKADGGCELALPTGPGQVVAMHESGWAQVDAADAGVVRLSPWAAVKGRAFRGDRPAANWTVIAQRVVDPGDREHARVLSMVLGRADAGGRFAFSRLPPGMTRVCLSVNDDGTAAPGYGQWLRPVLIDLSAGRTAEVNIGGDGRTIEGSIEMPAGTRAGDVRPNGVLAHRPPVPKRPMPPQVYNGTAEERKDWAEAFDQTPAATAWNAEWRKVLSETTFTPLEWTGPATFRVVDVPPGDYTIEFGANEAAALAGVSPKFVVPAAGPGGPAYVVPPVALHRPTPKAKAGDVAPDFAVVTLDNKPVKLSDYRGRVVLLDQWATWCGPCIAEIPALRAAYDAHAADERFVTLGVSYDETPETAKRYVEAQKLPWRQAWVGETIDPRLGEGYAGGLPTITLIGADGRVVETDLRGDAIKAAVDKALSK